MYTQFDGNDKKRRGWMPWALGVVSVLFLAALGLAIYFATSNDNDSSSSSNSGSSSGGDSGGSSGGSSSSDFGSNDTCTSDACVALADDILSSIDDTVDPCEDFFQYACGNWEDDNDWELVEYSAYNQFYSLSFSEMHTFLDAIYYDTDPSLVNHTSITKATKFYSSCYDSTVDMETVEESTVLQEFLEQVTFSDGTDSAWNSESRAGFIDTMAWLSIRGWNNLFELNVWEYTPDLGNLPWMYQNYQYWLFYNSTQYRSVVKNTYAPVYQQLFGINQSESEIMATKVADLADSIYEISTATVYYYDLSYMLSNQLAFSTFSNASNVFGNSELLNITSIISKTYNYNKFLYMIYYKATPAFIKNLASLLEGTTPKVVQYFLVTDVLTNFVNFESSYEQTRFENRVSFCYTQTLEYFPFVYGYILYHETYDDMKYNHVYNLVKNISENGIKVGLNDATWMEDDQSLAASLKKIQYLGIYVGLPPKITEYSALDTYYKDVHQTKSDFVGNLAALVDFAAATTQATMAGTLEDLISPWPSIFEDSGSYDSWLTGINAFYVPSGNYFTIPVTISQIPYYSVDYPSAVNFGGLGSVIGHEISHGFDPSGSYYNYNGSYGDIWSSATRSAYEENMQCFIDQYDKFEIVDGVYVNGTQTITENVADNGGNKASYYAWTTYIEQHGDDFSLPGVDMTSTQLFFWSWAHAWCETSRPSYYVGWTDVHAPNPARVWGVMQNSDAFAEAYGCQSGDPMNPTDKCILW